jgi:hypothetical protein
MHLHPAPEELSVIVSLYVEREGGGIEASNLHPITDNLNLLTTATTAYSS